MSKKTEKEKMINKVPTVAPKRNLTDQFVRV